MAFDIYPPAQTVSMHERWVGVMVRKTRITDRAAQHGGCGKLSVNVVSQSPHVLKQLSTDGTFQKQNL